MKNFRKIEDRKELELLLGKVLFKTFFHSLEWQDFLGKEFKWLKFEHYLYGDEALLTFARFKVFGKDKLISLPFCEYGGPLPLKEGIDFDKFNKDVLENFKNIKIKFHPRIEGSECNSDVSTHWIEGLNKLTREDLLKSFRKTLRHSIRDSQEHGLEIRKLLNIEELKQFYNLYVANLKRKRTIPYPFSVVKFLHHNPASEISVALYKNKIIAGSLFLHYGKFIHYFLNASDYKYRNFGASYLILWEKIKSLCGQDKIFDLGASPQGSNLEIFKRGWGGTECPIYQIGIKKSEEGLRSSKLRNIWKLLPNFAIKILSQYLIKYRI